MELNALVDGIGKTSAVIDHYQYLMTAYGYLFRNDITRRICAQRNDDFSVDFYSSIYCDVRYSDE